MRDLKKGDRVKITGPWRIFDNEDCGQEDVGNIETVAKIDLNDTEGMPILLDKGYWWCRENLRALPRR